MPTRFVAFPTPIGHCSINMQPARLKRWRTWNSSLLAVLNEAIKKGKTKVLCSHTMQGTGIFTHVNGWLWWYKGKALDGSSTKKSFLLHPVAKDHQPAMYFFRKYETHIQTVQNFQTNEPNALTTQQCFAWLDCSINIPSHERQLRSREAVFGGRFFSPFRGAQTPQDLAEKADTDILGTSCLQWLSAS